MPITNLVPIHLIDVEIFYNIQVTIVVVEIFLDLSGGSTDLQATSMAKNPSTKQDKQKGVAIVSC